MEKKQHRLNVLNVVRFHIVVKSVRRKIGNNIKMSVKRIIEEKENVYLARVKKPRRDLT